MIRSDMIGIMQGRLSRPQNGKIQSFPVSNWEQEFELAAKIGYRGIEWVVDSHDLSLNPLFSISKRRAIRKISKKYNVSIPAVCHDEFMEMPLHTKDQNIQKLIKDILKRTLIACEDLKISFIEIPLVKKSAIKNNLEMQRTIDLLADLEKTANKCNVKFLLETDLPPTKNKKLMEASNGLQLGLNYDMGNSVFWGFDPDIELGLLAKWIMNVHVKDCIPEIYSVPLGDGNVNFKKVFHHFKSQRYKGWFILQAAPAPIGKEIYTSKQYYQFTQKQLRKHFNES